MYTEYVFDNKKYEVAAREIKASLFDIVTTEEEKIANLREKAFVEVNSQEVAAELQELYVQQDTFLRDVLEIGEKLNRALQKADSCSRKLKQIEQKHAAQIIATIQEPVNTQENVAAQENVATQEVAQPEAVAPQPVVQAQPEVVAEQSAAEVKEEVAAAPVEAVAEQPAVEAQPEVVAEQPAAEVQTEVVAEQPAAEVQTEVAAEQPVVEASIEAPTEEKVEETTTEEKAEEATEDAPAEVVATEEVQEEKPPKDPSVIDTVDDAINAGLLSPEDAGDQLAGAYDPGSITASDVGAVSLGGLAPSSSYDDKGAFFAHERKKDSSDEPVIMSVEDSTQAEADSEQPVIVSEQPVITPIDDSQAQVADGASSPLIPPVIDEASVVSDNSADAPVIAPIPDANETPTITEATTDAQPAVAENATLYANFKKRSQDPPKVIMISASQAANLRKSFPTQEALLSAKGMFQPAQEAVTDANLEQQLMNNGLLDADTTSKQAQIEQMMEQANALYSSGQVEAAQNMYNQISILNKELQGESAGLAI